MLLLRVSWGLCEQTHCTLQPLFQQMPSLPIPNTSNILRLTLQEMLQLVSVSKSVLSSANIFQLLKKR